MIISQRLKELRKKNNLTQAELSKALNIKLSTYRDYERGTRKKLPIMLFWKIADFYGVSLDYLSGRED